MNVPRDLKPVLLEGTDGRYDPVFELIRLPLDEVVELWWASRRTAGQFSPFPYEVEIRNGSHKTWHQDLSENLSSWSIVISETSNPEWCFIAYLSDPYFSGFNFTKGIDGRCIARAPVILRIAYDMRDDTSMKVKYEHADFRFTGEGLVRTMWLHREAGKFDLVHVRRIKYNFRVNPNFKARGWKRLNHENIYAMCKEIGVDLQDPELLSGRYVIVDPERP